MIHRLDAWLQDRVDTGMALLDEHGIRVPTILRETHAALILASAWLAVTAVSITELWFISFLMAGVLFARGLWSAQRWVDFNRDARREWTIALAKKYMKRGIRMRETLRRDRLFHLVTLPLLGAVMAWSATTHFLTTFVVAYFLRYCVVLTRYYVEGSIPRPPPLRAPARAGLATG